MEEFDDLEHLVRTERHQIFKSISESVGLNTRFMVPDEGARPRLGNDGCIQFGLEALRRVLSPDGKATST